MTIREAKVDDIKQIEEFAIADFKGNNIWALFLDPKFEKKGIGQQIRTDNLIYWEFILNV